MKVAKRLTYFFKTLGVNYVFDTSFSRDFSLLESAREFVERYREHQSKQHLSTETSRIKRGANNGEYPKISNDSNDPQLPMLASSCPGWICYAEKTHGFILPYISKIKSPQQIMGLIVKDYFAKKLGVK